MACRKPLVAALLLAAALSTPAAAAVPPRQPSPPDLAAAVAAAGEPASTSIAKTNFRQVHGTDPTTITVSSRATPTYVLNPDFVRGTPGAPAGILQYVAVTATDEVGHHATLRVTPDAAGTWSVDSVFSGNDEEFLSARLAPDSLLLNEPQINGWYELTPSGVVLLRASTPQSPIGALISLPQYQSQVHTRYAAALDPLPVPAPTSPSTRDWSLPVAIGSALVLAAAILLRRRSKRSRG
ncbi:hypothetical protein [Actinokineospora terrae]|uniref:LPXTG-motif cell wall anchor domain-containing protein n=1 Tax=Actinokineospora terrae TaxID=155974 RepID=A0A1H9MX76_9PSEU|nr:hypothetical protein [Actinokineospora terrae]SER28316.1 hypothetical protein SAMN04487818_102392 [Actinokineospora terrae]